MAYKAKIVRVGESLVIEFPESLVKSQCLREGDTLSVLEAEDAIELRPTESLETRVARRVMDENREVLKRLADG